jgi:hypothetical protein
MSPRLPTLGPLARAARHAGAFALVFTLVAGCARPVEDGVIRRDSAGVEVVTVTAAAYNVLPTWTIDTGTRLFTIGGEALDQDVDRLVWAVKLEDGNILVGRMGPAEIRLHAPDGRFLKRVGRSGDGPGEFRHTSLYRAHGDSLLLWDGNLKRLTLLRTDGTVERSSDLRTLPRTIFLGFGGAFADGHLATMPLGWYQDSNVTRLDGERIGMPIYVIDIGRMIVDTQAGYPGFRVYQAEMTEGGQSFRGPAPYELDGFTAILVTDSGMTAAPADRATVLLRRSDGTIRRQTSLPLDGRQVTPELWERYIASESASVAREPFVNEMVANYRKSRVVERMPVFGRIHAGPGGEVWLERSWILADSVRDYVVLDATGAPEATLTLPMGRTIQWIGKDVVLATWHDDDDVTYLSAHPLRRSAQ